MTLSTSAVAVCCCRDFAQFVEQPRVLDGNDGLGSEVLDKIDLLIGKWVDILAVDGKGANQFVVAEHGYRERGACASDPRQHRIGLMFVGGKIADVDYFLRRDEGANDRRIHRNDRVAASRLFVRVGCVMHRRHAHITPVEQQQVAEPGVANPHRVFQHGLKNRLQFAGRRADDAQYVRRRRLLLQRLRVAR